MKSRFSSRAKRFLERSHGGDWARARTDWRALARADGLTRRGLKHLVFDGRWPGELRAVACWLYAGVEGRRAEPMLRRVMADIDPRVSQAAVQGLANVGGGESIPPLLGLLTRGRDNDVRGSVVYALGKLCARRAVPILIEILMDVTETPAVRGFAAESLGSIGDRGACSSLVECLDDSVVEVQWWAAFALGELGCDDALPKLQMIAQANEDLRHGRRNVTASAANAVWKIGRIRSRT